MIENTKAELDLCSSSVFGLECQQGVSLEKQGSAQMPQRCGCDFNPQTLHLAIASLFLPSI